MNWIQEKIHTKKAIIGLCHFKALPHDPYYDEKGGMEAVYEAAYQDVMALQRGGIDAIQFTNEFSMPYRMNNAKPETIAAMAYLIGRLKPHLSVPFGANIIGDTHASVGLCASVGAQFTRGSYHGAWASNYGIMNGECSEVYQLRRDLDCEDLKFVHYVVPESAMDLAGRDPVESLKAHYFLNKPDALGICGMVAGQKVDVELLNRFKQQYPEAVLFAVTGVTSSNAAEIMSVADAAFVGTYLKKDGIFENPVDENRVKELMDIVKAMRG